MAAWHKHMYKKLDKKGHFQAHQKQDCGVKSTQYTEQQRIYLDRN